MKKFMFLFVLALTSVFMVGCFGGNDDDKKDPVDETVVLVDEGADYFLTGQFAGWGDATGEDNEGEFLMTAVALGDARIASIKDQIMDAKFVYIYELDIPEEGGAGWTAEYEIDGEMVEVDGFNTIKVIKTNKNSEVPIWWGQSPESGEFESLTPDLLYIPPFVGDDDKTAAGGWNDNPIALEAGEYYVVYVQFAPASHGLALIKK